MVAPEKSGNDEWACLRNAREIRGLALEDAARVTRIASGYLRALEEGHIDKLPSEAYAKGFLRAYGHYLGFSDNDLQNLYRLIDSSSLPESEGDIHRSASSVSVSAVRTVKRNIMVAIVAFVAVMALFFYLAIPVKHSKRVADSSVPQRAHTDKETSASNAVKNEVAATKQQTVKAETTGVIPFSHSISPDKGVILKLKALEDGSLDVTIDDMITQHYDLKVGDLIEWKAEKAFSLDLDNAGGVEAEFDGKLLGPFGAKGRPAHIVLKADESSGETTP